MKAILGLDKTSVGPSQPYGSHTYRRAALLRSEAPVEHVTGGLWASSSAIPMARQNGALVKCQKIVQAAALDPSTCFLPADRAYSGDPACANLIFEIDAKLQITMCRAAP